MNCGRDVGWDVSDSGNINWSDWGRGAEFKANTGLTKDRQRLLVGAGDSFLDWSLQGKWCLPSVQLLSRDFCAVTAEEHLDLSLCSTPPCLRIGRDEHL